MTASTPTWALNTGISLSWPRRARRTPVEATASDRERHQLRRVNRRQRQDAMYRVAYQQFWARR